MVIALVRPLFREQKKVGFPAVAVREAEKEFEGDA